MKYYRFRSLSSEDEYVIPEGIFYLHEDIDTEDSVDAWLLRKDDGPYQVILMNGLRISVDFEVYTKLYKEINCVVTIPDEYNPLESFHNLEKDLNENK